ncbi:MAG: extracellular catalytic domain type 1 short-chain-length polyhydroxyalkanoate depolymerase, partial [Rhodanobacteraceae bacterium]
MIHLFKERPLKLPNILRSRFQPASVFDRLHRRTVSGSPPSSSVDASGIGNTICDALKRAGLMPEEKLSRSAAITTSFLPDHPGILRPATDVLGKHDVVKPTGVFEVKSFANSAGKRDYKLYIPENYSAQPGTLRPLVVMLHGCTQSPDDFALGTRMNQFADTHGFLVAYPAQAARANGSKCWNWFVPNDQRRGHGEPSLIAGITREVMSAYPVDPERVFVAGLSAGGAMAVVLGETYPELYAAVGVHSGLPFGAAHDVPSAFQVMADARARSSAQQETLSSSAQLARTGMPTIVFHGDADSTV